MMGTLSQNACKDLLLSLMVGRIGCNDGVRTYVVPVQFVYDGKDIYAHSVEGMKIHMMRKNPAVCFEVDEIQQLNNWKSVIAWGRYCELKSEYDRYNAVSLFTRRFLQSKISKSAILPAIGIGSEFPLEPPHIRPVIFRIILEEITGRFENSIHKSNDN